MKKPTCAHPEFSGFHKGSFRSPTHYGVFCFERPVHKTATPAQIADYRRREKIVHDNGGTMILAENEIAGENKPFSKQECDAMDRAITTANPGLRIADRWNGVGVYGYSVAVEKAART